MSDAKYFSTTKKGEIAELKEELNDSNKDRKKEAIKKVIAAMTVGKDVSMLFPEVIKCMHTTVLEIKKLVYLYLINYAKSNPDLTLLAVNTFVMDAQDHNPLLRALAVRTMGCIRVDKIIEYLAEPLRKSLRDDDPYVRKTAAVAVAKLHDMNPEMVEDQGFLEALQELLTDSNPMVIANAVAALTEIQETSANKVFQINSGTLHKLLAAINECTEWGQIFILDSLAQYRPVDSREAESIVERVVPRLQHANAAVVLSAVKVIIKYMDVINNADVVRTLTRKLAPPLVTLLSSEPEIQYVALRNINLIVQKRKNILQQDVKVFFCKYNDPVYVKKEKLEIMIMLASERNIEQVLMEFKEYATEADVDFVRRAVRAIGRCAIKLEAGAERCIYVLLDLIKTKVNYVVQEAIVVIKDIIRRYPNRYESVISILCENLDTLDEPEAKAAMIWIIGEYASRIDNADELLDTFLDGFADEPTEVQLQLLTAVVKLFLKRPSDTQDMVQSILTMATQETDNPDLRDRGYVYWRLLSTDPEAAKAVVLAEKPVIRDDSRDMDEAILNTLLSNIGTLSSVYHKPPETFVSQLRTAVQSEADMALAGDDDDDDGVDGYDSRPSSSSVDASAESAAAAPSGGAGDLLGLDIGGAPAAAPAAASAPAPSEMALLLPAERGNGLEVKGAFGRANNQVQLTLAVRNTTGAVVNGFMIQLNKNAFGFTPVSQVVNLGDIAPGTTGTASIALATGGVVERSNPPPGIVQVALKSSVGVIYFQHKCSIVHVFNEDGGVERQDFLARWRDIPDEVEATRDLLSGVDTEPEIVRAKLESVNVAFVAERKVPESGAIVQYFSAKTAQATFLLEVTLARGGAGGKICCRTTDNAFAPLVLDALLSVLA